MKKYLFCTIIVSLSLAGAWASNGQITIASGGVVHYTTQSGSEVRNYNTPHITIIKPTSYNFVFQSDGSTAKHVMSQYGYNVVINGGYFGWNPDGSYFPAGLRFQDGFILGAPPKKNDINLDVMISYNQGKLSLQPSSSFTPSILSPFTAGIYFNAGPRLVQQGKINHNIVLSYSHRQEKTYRTALLRKSNGDVYFLVSTQKIDLPQFIVFAFKNTVNAGDTSFDLVNLDGGSSTAIRSPKLSFNSNKTLPMFIWIR